MLPAVPVDDPHDPRLADFVGLTDAQLRRRYEADAGVCIAEGWLAIRQAVEGGARLRALLVTEARLRTLADIAESMGAPVYVASREVMQAVAGFDLHRGAVASVARPPVRDAGSLLETAHRVMVLEDVNDAENMGVLFRNAAGLGANAVLLSPGCCDPLYRRAVRVSMGHVLTLPFARLEPWPAGIDTVHDAGFTVAALAPRAARPLDEARLDEVDRVALLLGAEGPGLTDAALARADLNVAVPMAAGVDSLNVGSAAAIALYATRRRQRSGRPS